MKNYYVYLHIKLTDGTPFYVGKGKDRRAYVKSNRGEWWKKTIAKHGFDVILLEENLTEQEAFDREVYWIKRIGRKNLGLGPLINIADGGTGCSGSKMSDAHKQKLKDLFTGIPKSDEHKEKISNSRKQLFKNGYEVYNKGIPRTAEVKEKLRKSNPNKRMILDTTTGIYYDNIYDAAESINMKRTTLKAKLRGQNKNNTTLIYV